MVASAPALYVAEPPLQYRMQPPLVVDCSTLASLLFQEASQAEASQRIYGKTLHAPYLLQIEIASVALKKRSQGTANIASDGIEKFRNLRIDLHQVDPVAIYELAARYKLSAYDASYLWLAAELKAPLATFDEKLGRAAQTHLSTL